MHSFHYCWNGMLSFHPDWNGMVIPFLLEWNHNIPTGMEKSFHSSRNGIPF
jgi:hypothetical protein